MKEVSCRILDAFLRKAAARDIPMDQLTRDTGCSIAHLQNKNERIDWDTFCTFMHNVGEFWTPAELVEMGRETYRAPAMRYASLVARLLFSAKGFYAWLFERVKGAGNQEFTCVVPSYQELSSSELLLKLTIPDGFRSCPEFFLVCEGTMSDLPSLLGLPPATVVMAVTERGAEYRVTLPSQKSLGHRIRSFFLMPFNYRQAATELREAHHTLQLRYQELDQAKQLAAGHAAQLRAVNLLGRELASHTTFASLSEVIHRLLVERFDITTHLLYVSREELPTGECLELVIGAAGTPSGVASREVSFFSGGLQIGRLELWGASPPPPGEPDLLSDLTPWIAIALGNARSFAILREYQTDLEKKVADRTEQLQQSLQRRIESDRQKTQFFANASHELRTPLTLMLAPLETLIASGQLPEVSRDELRSVLRSGYRLLKLVNDILDLSKIGAGKLHLQIKVLDLSELVRQSLRPWEAALAQRQVKVETELPSPLRMIGDSERLEQVVLNLLSNAVRATPDGGTLRLTAARDGDQVSFSVFNSGASIAEEDRPRLFENFGQALHSPSRRFGSSGLGLPLVRDLVQLHGGEVELDSQEGKGVTFTIVLPSPASEPLLSSEPTPSSSPSLIELTQYQTDSESENEALPPASPDNSGAELPTLLLAEDNADVRGFLVRRLRGEYHILEADDGVVALELAREHVPDIVLSDVMMQAMDGMDLCRRLKADPITFAIPVILLTARSDLDAKILGLQHGADDYLVKPFFMEEVKARLRAQLRIRALVKQVARQEKLSAIGIIVAGVAHEIRNPLNRIINSLLPLKAVLGDPSAEVSELVDIAVESARRVEQISAQLLKQARAGEGEQSVVDLAQNIGLALQLLSHKAINGPKIDAQLSEAVSIVGEPGALNQVWVNLIDNAIQAAGPAGRITVNMMRENGAAVIEVSDNGPGIQPRHLQRIFDPFFSTKPVGTGTGLGLSVAREIVEKHGGTIAVQSTPGAGARFKILFPATTA